MAKKQSELPLILFEMGLSVDDLKVLVESFKKNFDWCEFIQCGAQDLAEGTCTLEKMRKFYMNHKELQLCCKLEGRSLTELVDEMIESIEVESDFFRE